MTSLGTLTGVGFEKFPAFTIGMSNVMYVQFFPKAQTSCQLRAMLITLWHLKSPS